MDKYEPKKPISKVEKAVCCGLWGLSFLLTTSCVGAAFYAYMNLYSDQESPELEQAMQARSTLTLGSDILCHEVQSHNCIEVASKLQNSVFRISLDNSSGSAVCVGEQDGHMILLTSGHVLENNGGELLVAGLNESMQYETLLTVKPIDYKVHYVHEDITDIGIIAIPKKDVPEMKAISLNYLDHELPAYHSSFPGIYQDNQGARMIVQEIDYFGGGGRYIPKGVPEIRSSGGSSGGGVFQVDNNGKVFLVGSHYASSLHEAPNGEITPTLKDDVYMMQMWQIQDFFESEQVARFYDNLTPSP